MGRIPGDVSKKKGVYFGLHPIIVREKGLFVIRSKALLAGTKLQKRTLVNFGKVSNFQIWTHTLPKFTGKIAGTDETRLF